MNLSINFNLNNQIKIQDIITKVTNRFLNLKKLTLRFAIAVTTDNFNFEENRYYKPLEIQTIVFLNLPKKPIFHLWHKTLTVKFKTINLYNC